VERVTSHRFTTALVASHTIASGIIEVSVERPTGFTFLPGQFVRFIMDGYERDYTIISHPDAETLDLCIALIQGGRFSTAIAQAPPGDRFALSGPHGHFIFQKSVRRPVFVATGTGVAPFVAFCRIGSSDALLLHGVASPDQLVYRDRLEPVVRTYVPCISGSFDVCSHKEGAFAGRVTAYLEKMLLPGAYDFYLCGGRAMINDTTALIDEHFDGSRIFIENFD
jgi:benzoate/toluate 1,2-dioxygenase reductase component